MYTKSEKIFLNSVLQKVGKGINQYKMIGADDKVMVAVSGGKDSLVMLETLVLRRKYLPIKYELCAVHIVVDDVPFKANPKFLKQLCDELEVPLIIKETHAGIDDFEKKKRACFTCSWNRRKELFQLCADKGFNKIAFGHHMDDMLETLLMNMSYHAEISSMPPIISMFEGLFEIIRPMVLLNNAELKRYANLKKFMKMEKNCPYEDQTNRNAMRQIIDQIAQISPKARTNMFRAMQNVNEEYLP
jgi:tRNA 2-thiocytidine biosynthesis protein TtcA